MTPLLELHKVCARQGGEIVLSDVTATLYAGEIVAVVGPNGAGKSTLLKVISGVLPAASGRLTFSDPGLEGADERGRSTAYLPQSMMPHWDLTVAELLRLGGQPHSRVRNGVFVAHSVWSGQMLDRLEIGGLLQRRLSTLSGGERSRALLAWALIGKPRLLAADEPLAALDPAQQTRALTVLLSLKPTVSTIVVLHDINAALRTADRVMALTRGRIAAFAPPAEIIASGILPAIFDVPMTPVPVSWGTALIPT